MPVPQITAAVSFLIPPVEPTYKATIFLFTSVIFYSRTGGIMMSNDKPISVPCLREKIFLDSS
jgi:hypothetical protein